MVLQQYTKNKEKSYMLLDSKEVKDMYEKLLDMAGEDAKKCYEVGCLCQSKSIGEYLVPFAYEFFEKAARQGHVNATFAIGMCYRWGECGVWADPELAIEWLSKAAELGHEKAKDVVKYYGDEKGKMMLLQSAMSGVNGYGSKWYVSEEAVNMYREQAESGDGESQYELARQLANASHIGPFYYDIDEAIKWYTKAGENGVVDAWFNLAMIYYEGSVAPLGFKGCGVDLEKAKYYLEKCAELGDEEAKQILEEEF